MKATVNLILDRSILPIRHFDSFRYVIEDFLLFTCFKKHTLASFMKDVMDTAFFTIADTLDLDP